MYKNILLAIDVNEKSSWNKALPMAISLCQSSGANLHLLTVVPEFGMSVVGQFFPKNFEKEVAGKILKTLKEFEDEKVPADVNSRCIVGEGSIYETILKMAKKVEADLIVVAAGRPELSDYLLGPNAARVVRHADTSVLVVRS